MRTGWNLCTQCLALFAHWASNFCERVQHTHTNTHAYESPHNTTITARSFRCRSENVQSKNQKIQLQNTIATLKTWHGIYPTLIKRNKFSSICWMAFGFCVLFVSLPHRVFKRLLIVLFLSFAAQYRKQTQNAFRSIHTHTHTHNHFMLSEMVKINLITLHTVFFYSLPLRLLCRNYKSRFFSFLSSVFTNKMSNNLMDSHTRTHTRSHQS